MSSTKSSIQTTMTRHAERQETVTTVKGKSSRQRLNRDAPDVGLDKTIRAAFTNRFKECWENVASVSEQTGKSQQRLSSHKKDLSGNPRTADISTSENFTGQTAELTGEDRESEDRSVEMIQSEQRKK